MEPVRTHSPAVGPDPEERAPDDPRVYLAAERTLLAWIRTGIALIGLGFLVAKFGLFLREIVAIRGGEAPEPTRLSLWLGCALVLLGIAATLLATFEYVWLLRRLRIFHQVGSVRLAMTAGLALIMALTGFIMAIYLLFL